MLWVTFCYTHICCCSKTDLRDWHHVSAIMVCISFNSSEILRNTHTKEIVLEIYYKSFDIFTKPWLAKMNDVCPWPSTSTQIRHQTLSSSSAPLFLHSSFILFICTIYGQRGITTVLFSTGWFVIGYIRGVAKFKLSSVIGEKSIHFKQSRLSFCCRDLFFLFTAVPRSCRFLLLLNSFFFFASLSRTVIYSIELRGTVRLVINFPHCRNRNGRKNEANQRNKEFEMRADTMWLRVLCDMNGRAGGWCASKWTWAEK